MLRNMRPPTCPLRRSFVASDDRRRGQVSEALKHKKPDTPFRTLKYMPTYPTAGFVDLEQARAWAMKFIDWYNTKHRHREIGFVTPEQRHSGHSHAVLAQRRRISPLQRSG